MSEPSEDEGSLFVSYQAFVFIQLKRENIGEVSTQNNNKVSKHVHFSYGWVRKQLLILTDALYKLQILTFFLAPTIAEANLPSVPRNAAYSRYCIIANVHLIVLPVKVILLCNFIYNL